MIWFDTTRNKMRCYQYLLRAMVKLIASEIGAPGHLAHAWHARIQTASLNKNHVKHVDTVKRDEDTQWTSQDKQFAHDCFRDFFSASVNRIYIYIYVYIYIMIHINHLYKWAYLKRFNLIQTFTHPVFGGVVGGSC